jgi:hypothetical protein
VLKHYSPPSPCQLQYQPPNPARLSSSQEVEIHAVSDSGNNLPLVQNYSFILQSKYGGCVSNVQTVPTDSEGATSLTVFLRSGVSKDQAKYLIKTIKKTRYFSSVAIETPQVRTDDGT